jgi:hypothetical protein
LYNNSRNNSIDIEAEDEVEDDSNIIIIIINNNNNNNIVLEEAGEEEVRDEALHPHNRMVPEDVVTEMS